MSAPSPWQVEKAFQALSEARARLLAIAPDLAAEDEQAYLENLEGEAEGDPLAMIDALVRASLDAADYAALAADRAKALAERKARFERREGRLQQTVLQMMQALDIRKIERPDYSASIGKGRVHVIPTKEPELLPPRFQRIAIEANKVALGDALRANEKDVPAEWSNPEPSITIRIR